MENLEMIKNWLDDCDILFSEGLYNINWGKIIQKIKKDPEAFIEEGGWGFLVDNVIILF
jgi:nucleosome binding factor SPN SPT16 subunit